MQAGVPEVDEWTGDENFRLTLVELAGRTQQSPLPIPLQNPIQLPLAALESEVFERLVAEMVSRQYNLGVQFYGRRGQAQYGLDIVEREPDSRRSLYQVEVPSVVWRPDQGRGGGVCRSATTPGISRLCQAVRSLSFCGGCICRTR